jgi:hypothetical protein
MVWRRHIADDAGRVERDYSVPYCSSAHDADDNLKLSRPRSCRDVTVMMCSVLPDVMRHDKASLASTRKTGTTLIIT